MQEIRQAHIDTKKQELKIWRVHRQFVQGLVAHQKMIVWSFLFPSLRSCWRPCGWTAWKPEATSSPKRDHVRMITAISASSLDDSCHWAMNLAKFAYLRCETSFGDSITHFLQQDRPYCVLLWERRLRYTAFGKRYAEIPWLKLEINLEESNTPNFASKKGLS